MKAKIWMGLILALLLAGCAGEQYGGYERAPYQRPYYETPYSPAPWYIDDGVPPLPVSPEVLGKAPGRDNPALAPGFALWRG